MVDSARVGLLACLLFLGTCAHAQNPFLFGGTGAPATELLVQEAPVIEGTTPANVVIERVVSFPEADNDTDLVVIRNIGGQTQDLTGWTVTDADSTGDSSGSSTIYDFGKAEGCEEYTSIAPSQKITLAPLTEENPCGFEFTVGIRDKISLVDATGTAVEEVEWSSSEQGTAIRRMENGTFVVLPETLDLVETLKYLGGFEILVQALEATGLAKALEAKSDPNYDGPQFPEAPPPPPIEPQFPAWFGFSVNRSELPAPPPPPPPPPPPKEGVPKLGPFTILAPTDEAFDAFRAQIAGPGNEPLPTEVILELPELKDILLYHIVPDAWSSEYLKNNTGIITAKTVEIVPFTDPTMGEGKILIHDSCVDKPTPDGIPCAQQAEFQKCYDPFMISPLGAQWQGGFCQRTCERCTCDPAAGAFCAEIGMADIEASNGVIHTINRLLFPPPKFEEVALAPESEADDTIRAPATTTAAAAGAAKAPTASTKDEKPKLTIGFKPSNEDK